MEKTLFVHPKNDYTGSTRVLSNILVSEYADKFVTVICQGGSKGFLSELPNVRLITCRELRLLGRAIPVVSDLLNRLKVFLLVLLHGRGSDIIYINTIVPYSAVCAALLLHKKITYHIHEKFINLTLSYKIMEYVFNHTTTHRIFVSEYTKSQYCANPRCTSEIKYNKLPESYLSKVRVRPLEKRLRNQVLMISSMSIAKGIDTFFVVANQLPQINFRLILSASQSSINDFMVGMRVPVNCEVLPSQADIHSFLYETDLILSLTNPAYAVETFGMTILEAMPYGIPAVVPNVGGPVEIVKNEYNGYCIDVTDVNLIVQYIEKSLDEANYKRLSQNTLRRFSEIFV